MAHPDIALTHRAGVGLKAEHYRIILATRPTIGLFEIHAENYMGAGGPPHRYLAAIRDLYPLSVHGVGLSIGAARPLDTSHLARLEELVVRYAPALVSEHLAWSSHDVGFLNDLLPLPYTAATLAQVVEHLDTVQDVLGRQILLENPSTYVTFAESTYSEVDFIAEVVRRSGCGLLLDINNLYVSCTNHQRSPVRYMETYPLAAVREIHLAGHALDTDERDRPLLIDTHDRPVADSVWELFRHAIRWIGPVPTVIEWDTAVPDWPTLQGQADHVDTLFQEESLWSDVRS